MSNEEIKQILESRLAKIMTIAKVNHGLTNDVILGKHAQGIVDAIEGINGEQSFLEELIDKLR